jgi:hypothetical protein
MFPEKFKVARVRPSYKKGDICSIQNYGPISILPIFSKILDNLMYSYSRLIIFLNKHNIIQSFKMDLGNRNPPLQQFSHSLRESKKHWIMGCRKWAYFLI